MKHSELNSREWKAKVGRDGELTACKYLTSLGHRIISQNYRKKWGEIDIIATTNSQIRFIEVKTVAHQDIKTLDLSSVSDSYRPEDNVHPKKLDRIRRTAVTYIANMNVSDETKWGIDLIIVYLDPISRLARVRMIKDIL